MSKPTIGITFSPFSKEEERERLTDTLADYGAYSRILFLEGSELFSEEELRGLQGVLLAGGGDMHPSFWGEEDMGYSTFVSESRDSFEVNLLAYCHKHNIPTLGICRGFQVMNVTLGGSLYQDILQCFPNQLALIEPHRHNPPRKDDYHALIFTPGTKVEALLARPENVFVNSRHHQAPNFVPDPLDVAAVTEDGIIEAVEAPDRRFFVGVGWHPEDPEIVTEMENLWRAFLET